MTTIRQSIAAVLKSIGLRAAADMISPEDAGGPGPRPKRWWWPW